MRKSGCGRYDVIVFDPRDAPVSFTQEYPYDTYIPWKKVPYPSLLLAQSAQ